MNICVNGAPKSGTHALLKVCELLGQSVPGGVNHIPYGQSLPEGTDKHLFIVRDPRNVLISWLRHNRKSVTDGTFMSAMNEYDFNGYSNWIEDKNVYAVRFEDLIASDKEIRCISDFLGVPYLDSAFENLPGCTMTWTGKYSDYRKIWTPALEAFWNENGGPELLIRFGY